MDEIDQRIQQLEDIHKNFQIVSGSNVTVEGSLKTGYAICATCPQAQEGTGTIPTPPPPPSTTGACCAGSPDGSCVVVSEEECFNSGGTYLGDGTDCSPIPAICCPVIHVEFGTSGTVDLTEGCTGDGCYLSFNCPKSVAFAMNDGCVSSHSGTEVQGSGSNICFGTPAENCDGDTGCGYTWNYTFTADMDSWTVAATCIIDCGDCHLELIVSGSGNTEDDITTIANICGVDVTVLSRVSFT